MAAKTVAISQSNYIPWKGYFDFIQAVDEFVLLDEVQYTRRDWRNRNRIKTPQGLKWLSIPVQVKNRFAQPIQDTRVDDPRWAAKHMQTLKMAYSKAPHFGTYEAELEALYERAAEEPYLSRINRMFLEAMNAWLGIETPFTWSDSYAKRPGRTERILDICEQLGAEVYVSGPAAKAYIDDALFREAGVEIRYMDYGGYPEYDQLHPPFEHGVTALDLLFHTGPDAARYLKGPAAAVPAGGGS